MEDAWIAVRYGEWSWGWERYEGKPFGFFRDYYDGEIASLHIGPLWVCVQW